MKAAESPGPSSDISSLNQDNSSGSLFKFEKTDKTSLLQLKGSAADRKQADDDTGSLGLEALYGHLFMPIGDLYSGYYFLSGKLESDNRQRFNATLAYFPPKIGGESKLTYRLLHAQIRDSLPLSGEFEEGALEQGIGLTYRKRFNLFMKEMAVKYAYTHLGGESVETGPYNLESPTLWRQVRANLGFGDVNTHDALLEFAAGSDALDIPLLQGIRFDLGGGYQHVNYGEYLNTDEVTDEGFTGIAELKACTPIGVLKGWYQDSQAAKTAYGGYQLGGLDVYYKNIDYQYGEDEEIIGIAFTLDLFDTGAAFDRSCRPFFYPSDNGYISIHQMEHISGLTADEFTAKPRVNEIITDIYRVDKTQLPGNVRVDDSGQTRLIVTTSCSLTSIRSVDPPAATSAFGVNGNEISIDLAGLPNGQQAIVARVNDNCCGDTQVTVRVHVGSLAVDSVNVREGVGCQPSLSLLPANSLCTSDAQCEGDCYFNASLGESRCTGGYQTDIPPGMGPCTYDFQCQNGTCLVNQCIL